MPRGVDSSSRMICIELCFGVPVTDPEGNRVSGVAAALMQLTTRLFRNRGEGEIAGPFAALAKDYPDLTMGSYPFIQNGAYGTNLVIRGTDPAQLDAAMTKLCALFA